MPSHLTPFPWPHPGLINWLPTFFSEFYHVDIGDLSGFTMTPYLVQVRLPTPLPVHYLLPSFTQSILFC